MTDTDLDEPRYLVIIPFNGEVIGRRNLFSEAVICCDNFNRTQDADSKYRAEIQDQQQQRNKAL